MINLRKNIKAQSTIEFTFTIVAVMFLIYGMVQIFRWAGMDLVNRRMAQDSEMVLQDGVSYGSNSNIALSTLTNAASELFLPMAAVYHGSITNNGTVINDDTNQ